MSEKVELSNSKLMSIESCGEHFRRKYLDKEFAPGTLRMHRGAAVHTVSAEGHRRQFEAKRLGLTAPLKDVLLAALPSEEEAKDLAASTFDGLISDGVTLAKEDVEEAGSEKMAIGQAKDATVDMAGYYTTRIAPTVNPIAFERRITLKPKDSPMVVRGILDLVEQEEANPNVPEDVPGEIIPDLKTSERSPQRELAEKDQQLTLYAMLRTAETGELPKAEVLRYVVRTPKMHDLKRVELRTRVTRADIAALVHRLNVAVEAIQKGVFVPAAPNHWRCSARWCEFFHDCRFALRRE